MRQTRRTNRKSKKQRGGIFGWLLAADRIRGQRYDHFLEQRLVMVYNDFEFVDQLRKRYGYDKTALKEFTMESVKDDFNSRPKDEKDLILSSGRNKTAKRRV